MFHAFLVTVKMVKIGALLPKLTQENKYYKNFNNDFGPLCHHSVIIACEAHLWQVSS